MKVTVGAPDNSSHPECSADKSRRLWSYAFPYMPPPVVEIDKLGVPSWWMATLEEPMSTGQDGANTVKRSQNSRKKQPTLSRQGSLGQEKGQGLTRTGLGLFKAPADSSENFKPLKPAAFEDGSKSMFRSANLTKIL